MSIRATIQAGLEELRLPSGVTFDINGERNGPKINVTFWHNNAKVGLLTIKYIRAELQLDYGYGDDATLKRLIITAWHHLSGQPVPASQYNLANECIAIGWKGEILQTPSGPHCVLTPDGTIDPQAPVPRANDHHRAIGARIKHAIDNNLLDVPTRHRRYQEWAGYVAEAIILQQLLKECTPEQIRRTAFEFSGHANPWLSRSQVAIRRNLPDQQRRHHQFPALLNFAGFLNQLPPEDIQIIPAAILESLREYGRQSALLAQSDVGVHYPEEIRRVFARRAQL